MSGANEECAKTCPYRNTDQGSSYSKFCTFGTRILLEEVETISADDLVSHDSDGNKVEIDKTKVAAMEVVKYACGSPLSPDRDLPTISINDYGDTQVSVSELRKLHDLGMLPEQL